MNIPFISSKTCEADVICSALYRLGIVQGCLTNDTDMLPFRCRMIQFFSNKYDGSDTVVVYELERILKTLDITESQFIDMCCLCKNPYNTFYIPLKIEEILSRLKIFGSIDKFIDNYNKQPRSRMIMKVENFKPARDIFNHYIEEGFKVVKKFLEKKISHAKEIAW